MKKIISIITGIFMFTMGCQISMAQVVDPVDKNKIANGGYDLVAYFTDHTAEKGTAEYTTEYHGAKYRFSSADHQQLFQASPEKYLPVCDGYCAWGVAEKGKKVPVNPMTYKIIDGKLYLFFNGDFNGKQFNTLTEWNKNQEQLLAELQAKWSKLNQ